MQAASYCTTGYDVTSDPSAFYGRCGPCVAGLDYTVTARLSVLQDTIRFQGTLQSIEATLAGLTYIARQNVQNLGLVNNEDTLYDDVSIKLVSINTRSVVAETTATVGILQIGYDAGKRGLSVVLPNALGDYIYGVEDSLLFLNGFELSNSVSIDDSWLSISKVTVTISVLFGDVFLTSYENLIFSSDNITKSLTFSGTCGDINKALSSLVYVPQNNWNSLVASEEEVQSSVFRIALSVKPSSEIQVDSLFDFHVRLQVFVFKFI
jgi:hypothetical protein